MNKLSTVRWAWMTLLVWVLIGCQEHRLERTEEPQTKVNAKSQGEFCLSEPGSYRPNLKLLFVVDKSGSNEYGERNDPGGKKRAGNLQRFYNKHRQDSSLEWGMITFQGHTAEAEINDGTPLLPAFTNSPGEVDRAIESIRDGDASLTPYTAALNMTKAAIRNDLNVDQRDNTYVVVFVSDGIPNEPNPDNGVERAIQNLRKQVEEIRSVNPGRVVFNTAFYGESSARATRILQEMSDAGKGEFINFEENEDWDFDQFIDTERGVGYRLKEFLVYNANAGFCLDGSVDTDSDSDGMCDKDEKRFGYDPTRRSSRGDGYSDYLHWYEQRAARKGDGQRFKDCNSLKDSDKDLLSDCEEEHLYFNKAIDRGLSPRSLIHQPDTDRDGILDGIELFTFLYDSHVWGLDPENIGMRFDNEPHDALEQIRQHRNPLRQDVEAPAYDTKIVPNETKWQDGKICYTFEQSKLPLYPTLKTNSTLSYLEHEKNKNKILVYFIESPQNDPNGPGRYHYSVQELTYKVNDPLGETQVEGLEVSNKTLKPLQ